MTKYKRILKKKKLGVRCTLTWTLQNLILGLKFSFLDFIYLMKQCENKKQQFAEIGSGTEES